MTWLKWKLVLVYLEIVLILTQDRYTVCAERTIGAWFVPNVPYAQKLFWMHPMVLLGEEAQVEGRFGPFGDSANFDAR